MTQRVDVGNRLTTGRQDRGHVDQHLPAVMEWNKSSAGQRHRQPRGQTDPVASRRTAEAPANGTTPVLSALTDSPCDQPIDFTSEVLLDFVECDLRQASFSQVRSTFS